MRTDPLCTLWDCTIEYESDDGMLPPVPGAIDSIPQLIEHLHTAAARRPHTLRMDLPDSFRACIHIGGPQGAIYLTRVSMTRPMPANAPGGWIPLPDRPMPVSEWVSFLTEGSTAEDDIYGDQLLPVADVIQIAAYLAEHLDLPPSHGWVCHYGNGTCTYVAKRVSSAAETAAKGAAEPFSPNGQLLRDEEDYLQAIASSPHDRLLRRLYADWLEAYFPRRTELIRVCEAMRDLPVWSDRYWELKGRRNELWEQCPLDWLEATGYDGSAYDPVFRDGVPEGCRERWRLIREFTERWHGISVPDVGGRLDEIEHAEERLGLKLPPSLREFVAYVHDIGDSAPSHDPRHYNTLFHSAYFSLHHLHRHAAVSLIHFTLDNAMMGVAHEDLGAADPPAYLLDEVLHENGTSIRPPSSGPRWPPIILAPSLTLSIFQSLFTQLPTAADSEVRGADPTDWLPRLAADFPIHARFGDAHVFESDELLVLVSRRGVPTTDQTEYVVEVIVRRPIPVETIPDCLFTDAASKTGSVGLLTSASYCRKVGAKLGEPGVPQPAWGGSGPAPVRCDPKVYKAWVRYSGMYPLWLSILRRREAERCEANSDKLPAQDAPSRPNVPHAQNVTVHPQKSRS